MKKSLESLLDEIQGRLSRLESDLPRRLDAMAISPISKLPFKALLCRGALMWRMAELGRVAFENFQNNKLVSAIVLTRAAVETSAALWNLRAKLDATVRSGAVGDIDDYLMKLTMGTATSASPGDPKATDPVLPRPLKISAFLKNVNNEIEGFSHQYGILSEYSHPNWAGTVFLYSKHNPAERSTIFGQNMRGNGTKAIGVRNLSTALRMFEITHSRVADLIPAFIALCESHLIGE